MHLRVVWRFLWIWILVKNCLENCSKLQFSKFVINCEFAVQVITKTAHPQPPKNPASIRAQKLKL